MQCFKFCPKMDILSDKFNEYFFCLTTGQVIWVLMGSNYIIQIIQILFWFPIWPQNCSSSKIDWVTVSKAKFIFSRLIFFQKKNIFLSLEKFGQSTNRGIQIYNMSWGAQKWPQNLCIFKIDRVRASIAKFIFLGLFSSKNNRKFCLWWNISKGARKYAQGLKVVLYVSKQCLFTRFGLITKNHNTN